MKVDIEALTFKLSLTRRLYIENAAKLALGPSARHIDLVEVRLSEFRAPDGDLHQRCLVWVGLDCGAMVVSESSDAELCFAVDRATDRVSWRVARAIRREQAGAKASRPARIPGSADDGNRRSFANGLDAA